MLIDCRAHVTVPASKAAVGSASRAANSTEAETGADAGVDRGRGRGRGADCVDDAWAAETDDEAVAES